MEFEPAVTDPSSWIRQARHLFAAADGLRECFAQLYSDGLPTTQDQLILRSGYLKGCLILLAGSIENAFKAVIVSQSNGLVVNGVVDKKKLEGGGTGHDLSQLAKTIGLELSREERRLLQRLTTIGKWAGKYQHPLKESEYLHSQKENPRSLTFPMDFEVAESLLERAIERVKMK